MEWNAAELEVQDSAKEKFKAMAGLDWSEELKIDINTYASDSAGDTGCTESINQSMDQLFHSYASDSAGDININMQAVAMGSVVNAAVAMKNLKIDGSQLQQRQLN